MIFKMKNKTIIKPKQNLIKEEETIPKITPKEALKAFR